MLSFHVLVHHLFRGVPFVANWALMVLLPTVHHVDVDSKVGLVRVPKLANLALPFQCFFFFFLRHVSVLQRIIGSFSKQMHAQANDVGICAHVVGEK